MSLDVRYYITCDKCLERPDEPGWTAKQARKIAEQDGFVRVAKQDLCAECFLGLPAVVINDPRTPRRVRAEFRKRSGGKTSL